MSIVYLEIFEINKLISQSEIELHSPKLVPVLGNLDHVPADHGSTLA